MKTRTKEPLNVTIDKDVKAKVEEYADIQRMSLSAWVNMVLARATGLMKGDMDMERNDDE